MVAAEDETFWSKLIKSPLAKKLFANVPKLEWFGERSQKMKLFNYSFDQSLSFVNEDIVNKLNQKGNWKRYIGLLITSVVLYFFLVAIPMFVSGHTVEQAPN